MGGNDILSKGILIDGGHGVLDDHPHGPLDAARKLADEDRRKGSLSDAKSPRKKKGSKKIPNTREGLTKA